MVPASFQQNELLRRFPQDAHQHLGNQYRRVPIPSGKVLYEQLAQTEVCYFPINGTLSNIVTTGDGSMIEVATVGNEGGVGVNVSTPARTSPHRVIGQVPGESFTVRADLLQREVRENNALRDLLDAYNCAFLYQISLSVACNGLHQVEQRCCRWLLMTLDRVDGNEFKLTQEFLAYMLGVRRPTVTDVMQSLQDRGILRYQHGVIAVLDRVELERSSCECYGLVRKEYTRLLG